MAHDEPAKSRKQARLVIRNIGLLLSGDLENPILDADTVVALDGRIAMCIPWLVTGLRARTR